MVNKLLDVLRIDFTENRVFGLDFLRSIAILLVMIGHSVGYLPLKIQQFIKPFLVDGVAIFFVLSGFLIGGIMIKSFQKEINFKNITNFWIRRWMRTLPNYYLILSILLITQYMNGGGSEDYLKYFFFLQNFYFPMGHFFPESWSLTIEEWFYTLTPLLLFLTCILARRRVEFKKILLLVIALVILSVLFYRIGKYFSLEVKNYYIYDRYFLRQLLSRIDAIMFGVFGAWINYYYHSFFIKKKNILLVLGIAILILTHNFEATKDYILYIFSFSFTSVGVLLMLPFMSTWKDTRSILKKPIIYCSLLSYSMYLSNLSLVDGFLENLLISSFGKFLLFWGITIILSLFLYKYFELPIIRYRDRITKK